MTKELVTKTIPTHLMPDSNNQFLINHPFKLVYDPNRPLSDNVFVQPELDQWFFYDSWNVELACKLITLGYNISLEKQYELVKTWPHDCVGRYRFDAMVSVVSRAISIANSSVNADLIKENDTPKNWKRWAVNKGYSIEHLSPESNNNENEITTPTKLSKNQRRDIDFEQWLNETEIDLNTLPKKGVHDKLIVRDRYLWTSGFPDWWKQQNFHKYKQGRKKND